MLEIMFYGNYFTESEDLPKEKLLQVFLLQPDL